MDKVSVGIYLWFIGSLLTLISCSKEDTIPQIVCENRIIDLDTIILEENSRDFIPYTGLEKIYFKNENGSEVEFLQLYGPLKHSYHEFDFEIMCEESDFNEYVFNREQFSVSHKCAELNLQYYLNVYVQNSHKQPKFVDVFNFLLHAPALDNFIDTAISIRFITNDRGNEELLNDDFKHDNIYQFAPELLLNHKLFHSVYFNKQPNSPKLLTEVYYTKEQGLIGFKDIDGMLWVLDRIE